jgi:hypothetical protein
MPEILAIAYHSFVGSSGPVSSWSSDDRLIGIRGIDADDPRYKSFSAS